MFGCNKDCPKRSTDCHSNCIDYLFGSAMNEIKNEKIRKDKELIQAPIERGVKISKKFNKRDWRK